MKYRGTVARTRTLGIEQWIGRIYIISDECPNGTCIRKFERWSEEDARASVRRAVRRMQDADAKLITELNAG